eukprot:617674_1
MGGGIERTDTSIKIQEQSAGPSLCVEGSETVEVESEPASCTSTRGHQFTESEIEHIHKMRKRYPRPSWPSMHEGMRSTFPNFRADNVSASSLQMKYSRLMRGKTTVGGRPQTGRPSRISDEQVYVIHKIRKSDPSRTWRSVREELQSTFPDFKADNVSLNTMQMRYSRWASGLGSVDGVPQEPSQKHRKLDTESSTPQSDTVESPASSPEVSQPVPPISPSVHEVVSSKSNSDAKSVEASSRGKTGRPSRISDEQLEHIHKIRKSNPSRTWRSVREELQSTFPDFNADLVSINAMQLKYSRWTIGQGNVNGLPQEPSQKHRKLDSDSSTPQTDTVESPNSSRDVSQPTTPILPSVREVISSNSNSGSKSFEASPKGKTGRQSRISDEQEQSVEPSLCPEGNETVEVESEPTSSLSTRGHLFTAAEIQHIHKLRKADTRPTWKSIYEEMRSTFPDFRSDNVSFHALQKITRVIRGKTRVGVVTQPGRPSRISD